MRVIAGRFKGRRLKAPTWDGLRPTSDTLRETLFNIVAPRIAGARVLDAFAGTGALGIEAMSRGAAHVTFIDADRRAAALIEANVAHCGMTAGYTVRQGDALTVMTRMPVGETYSLVLLDPPYADADIAPVLDASASRLDDDGWVVLERATRGVADVPASLAILREVRSGDSTLTFLVKVETMTR